MNDQRSSAFCPRCGRDLRSDFHFCPACGRAVDGIASFDAVLDSSFSRLSSAEASASVDRLDALDSDLKILEAELESFFRKDQKIKVRRR